MPIQSTQRVTRPDDQVEFRPSTYVSKETPAGAVDGVNAVFTLAFPHVSGTEEVYLNGILQSPGGVDYAIAGPTMTFVLAPVVLSVIRASYWRDDA